MVVSTTIGHIKKQFKPLYFIIKHSLYDSMIVVDESRLVNFVNTFVYQVRKDLYTALATLKTAECRQYV